MVKRDGCQPARKTLTSCPMKTPPTVNCPICSTPVRWVPESRYRPFCSERCRKIDLGAWANEEYRVAAVEAEKDALDDLPPD